jgi:hypothetical protein
MQGRKVEPGNPGCVDLAPQNRGATPRNEERRQAGTPATLEGNIENTIDEDNDIRRRPGAQAYPIRWLLSHYRVSAAVAGIIATELDMRGAR